MELFSLKCFVTVARLGSFSRAAGELYRTQPAVSLQVRKLERELGRPLFDRARRAPVMTEAGRALYDGARDLLERMEGLAELAGGGEPAGTLTVASNLSLISHFLPRAVRRFHRAHPKVLLRLLNRRSRDIGRCVEEGDADLGVGFLVHDGPGLQSTVLFTSPLLLIAPAGEAPSLDKVLAGPVVHFEEGADLRRFLERAFAGRRSLEPVIELPSMELILQFVGDGFGSTILPAFALSKSARKRFAVRTLGRSVKPLEVCAYTRSRREVSRAGTAFLELLEPPSRSAVSTR
jgi:DNA-binding transcriptional LysR family regulator